MIEVEVEYDLPTMEGFDLAGALDQIGRYKQADLRYDVQTRFSPEQTGALAEGIVYEVEQDGVTWTSTAHYSRIQKEGGFIAASPVTVTRRFNPSGTTPRTQRGGALPAPFQTYQMARFFWARYYATGEQKYLAMALAVHRDGGVTIRPHEWFMEWKDEDLEYITDLLRDYTVSFFNSKGHSA